MWFMSISLVLLAVLGVALLVPLFGDDDGDDRNEILGSSDPDDDVQGTEGNDLIRTFLGEDEVFGNGGNDEIRSGGDDDYVEGGDGLDFVRAGDGDDEVYGGDQDDRLFGDQGNDLLDGERGSDVIRGGRGDDLIFGGSDNLDGQSDNLSGEDDDDTIFGWGDGTFMGGGQNDVPDNPGSNNDTLVMVTGEGEMENRTGNNTNIGLANIGDADTTDIIVRDFNPADDNLVLTIDYATSGSPMAQADAEFTVNYSFEDATDDRAAGLQITVTWDNPDGDVGATEASSAFLLGFTQSNAGTFNLDPNGGSFDPEDPSAPLDIEVFLTNEASLDDPVQTLLDLGIATPAMIAQGFTLAPPP